MSKKYIIIGLVIVLFLAAVGFYAYQKGYFQKKDQTPTWQKLLTLEIKDKDMSQEEAASFQSRFETTKEQLMKNRDNFDSWLALGVIKKGVGDYEGARDVFIYAGQIRPQLGISYGNLADLYAYFLDEPQKAEETYKIAIEKAPSYSPYYSGLADLYRYKFPNGDALYEQTMLDALKKIPDEPNLTSALASFYRQRGEVQKAIEYYEKLVKLQPQNETAKQDLAELKAKVK